MANKGFNPFNKRSYIQSVKSGRGWFWDLAAALMVIVIIKAIIEALFS